MASLGGYFDLDLHFGLQQRRHDEQGRRRPDVAKLFAADRKRRIGISGLYGNTRYPEGVFSHGMYEQLRAAFPAAPVGVSQDARRRTHC